VPTPLPIYPNTRLIEGEELNAIKPDCTNPMP
jgi:hypothetical protein